MMARFVTLAFSCACIGAGALIEVYGRVDRHRKQRGR